MAEIPLPHGLKPKIEVVPRTGPVDTPAEIDLNSPTLPLDPCASVAPQLATLAGYEIMGELGRGGVAVVYKARHLTLQRIVAIKILLGGVYSSPHGVQRFRTEAQLLAKLQHPHLVQIHEIAEEKGLPYLVLEFLEGGSLADKLRSQPPLSPPQAAQLVMTLAQAVFFIHQRGIVHRDLKPSNILLTAAGLPKISDFGVAKWAMAAHAQTQSGAILGTPSYMAPEQAQGHSKNVTFAADIYALGAILYELLTGRPPFVDADPVKTILDVIREDPPPPRRLQAKVPIELETICLKCLHKDPDRRYVSAIRLADDLKRFLDDKPIWAHHAFLWEKLSKWIRRHPALTTGFGFTTAGILMVLSVLWMSYHRVKAERNEAVYQQVIAQSERDLSALRLEHSRRSLFAAQVNKAAYLLQRGEVPSARDLLADTSHCPFDLREFSWGFLARADSDNPVVLPFAAPIASVAISPSGGLLAVGLGDGPAGGTILVRDLASQRELLTLPGHPGGVTALAFASDSLTLASGGEDAQVRQWDLATGKELNRFEGHRKSVTAVAFLAGDAFKDASLVSGSKDGTVRLWSLEQKKQTKSLKTHADQVLSLAISPDGKTLATGSADTTAVLWDLASDRILASFRGHRGSISSLAFSPDGNTLATAASLPGRQGEIRCWDSRRGTIRAILHGHAGFFQTVVFTPDGKTLITAGADHLVKLWDPITAQERATLFKHQGAVLATAISPDGRTLATGSADRTVALWRSTPAKAPALFEGHAGELTSLAFAPDGSIVATAGADQTIKLWDMNSGQEHKTLTGHQAWIWALAFAPDGKTLVSGDDQGIVKVWDMPQAIEKLSMSAHNDAVRSLVFHPQGHLFATGSKDATAKIWDTASSSLQTTLRGHGRGVWSLAFHPDGNLLAVGAGASTQSGNIKIWDLLTGKEHTTLQGHRGAVTSLGFAPDGQRIVSASDDWSVKLWHWPTVKEHKSWQGFNLATFSSDGKFLALAGGNQTVRLIEPVKDKEYALFTGHKDKISALAFDPKLKYLASTSWDTTMRLWSVDGVKRPRPTR